MDELLPNPIMNRLPDTLPLSSLTLSTLPRIVIVSFSSSPLMSCVPFLSMYRLGIQKMRSYKDLIPIFVIFSARVIGFLLLVAFLIFAVCTSAATTFRTLTGTSRKESSVPSKPGIGSLFNFLTSSWNLRRGRGSSLFLFMATRS